MRDAGRERHRGSGIVYRAASQDDLWQTSRVFRAAANDLSRRHGLRPSIPADDARIAIHGHLLRHDAPRFWVAESDAGVVGFGAGIARGEWWFLSSLFVLPDLQGRGVGRELLEHAMAGYPLSGGVAATIADAIQPLSNTLYARHGLLARWPVIRFTGRLEGVRKPPLPPRGCRLEPVHTAALADLRHIDERVTGIDRTPDHSFLLSPEGGRRGWLVRREGRPTGYVLVDPSGVIGPAASVRAALMTFLMEHALTAVAAGAADTVSVLVPGANECAQRVLFGAGLVFEAPCGLLLQSRPFGRFDRYVFGSYGLM